MGVKIQQLWQSPEVNPVNGKARSIPGLNPFNVYGRVFFFSWFGFMIAFWSWYAFPPLLHDIIKEDLQLEQFEIANSNIIALTSTLLMRVVSGDLCDRFGPRVTFIGCLVVGAIPTFMAGLVTNAAGLMALRFFIGILGATFVPCQVWTTAFYDKNVVGTANALTGGFGNVGGGVTYFAMPAIYRGLVDSGLAETKAWRVAFVVPGIFITVTALGMLFTCPDTPFGKWSDRKVASEAAIQSKPISHGIVNVPGEISAKPGSQSPSDPLEEKEIALKDSEAQLNEIDVLQEARAEVIQKPTLKEILMVFISPQTIALMAGYFNSFGGELAINSVLGSYYKKNFPHLGLVRGGQWAAMFGMLNFVFRPLGGVVSDLAYKYTGSLWAKKLLIVLYGCITGAFLIAIGILDSTTESVMFGLVAGMAFFMDGGNGLNFGLVPHVHPYANGIVSGFTGASGNFGGIIYAIIFRYNGKNYGKVFWIMGVMMIAINLLVSWIRPIPVGQVGGHGR